MHSPFFIKHGGENRNMQTIITSEAQFNELMGKKAKGFVTQITKNAKKLLKENVQNNFYSKPYTSFIKKPIKNHTYQRTGDLYDSISENQTANFEDYFSNEVYFDQEYFNNNMKPKNKDTLGTYYNVHNTPTPSEIIEENWIEDGSDGGLYPRKGAHFIRDTMQMLEDRIGSQEFNYELENYFGAISVTRYK